MFLLYIKKKKKNYYKNFDLTLILISTRIN